MFCFPYLDHCPTQLPPTLFLLPFFNRTYTTIHPTRKRSKKIKFTRTRDLLPPNRSSRKREQPMPSAFFIFGVTSWAMKVVLKHVQILSFLLLSDFMGSGLWHICSPAEDLTTTCQRGFDWTEIDANTVLKTPHWMADLAFRFIRDNISMRFFQLATFDYFLYALLVGDKKTMLTNDHTTLVWLYSQTHTQPPFSHIKPHWGYVDFEGSFCFSCFVGALDCADFSGHSGVRGIINRPSQRVVFPQRMRRVIMDPVHLDIEERTVSCDNF